MTDPAAAVSDEASPDSPPKAPSSGRVLSGNRPTGPLHLGNYVGAVKNWVDLQDEFECLFMVADWHALTSDYADSSHLAEYSRGMMLDWIGAGLDPEKSVLFIQSQVKEHAELALLLGMFTPIPWLERTPSFKDMQAQMKDKELNTHGFLGYPVLQAADIILYKADVVPVGEDQLAHLELCREIVRRVHHFTGVAIFPEPKPKLSRVPKLLGTDGRKMSKSWNNCVYLSDTAEGVWAKVKEMVTDPARVRRTDPGTPEICSVFSYHKIFTADESDEIATDCRSAAIGCVDCKKRLAASIGGLLDPMRERRAAFDAKPEALDEIIDDGNTRARKVACETMGELREVLHLPA